jgi:hypothetical protein
MTEGKTYQKSLITFVYFTETVPRFTTDVFRPLLPIEKLALKVAIML